MLETIRLIGAIVGLATGAFTVWDRWARGRPLAWVTIKKIVNPIEYIRIKNPGPADVFILGVRAHPPIYGIAKDHSAGAIVEATLNIDANVLLWQGETCDLPLIDLRNQAEIPKDAPPQPVRFVIYWRKTSSTWLRQIPVVIMTSTHDIKRMAKAAAEQRD
jgi:hypothetical protein